MEGKKSAVVVAQELPLAARTTRTSASTSTAQGAGNDAKRSSKSLATVEPASTTST